MQGFSFFYCKQQFYKTIKFINSLFYTIIFYNFRHNYTFLSMYYCFFNKSLAVFTNSLSVNPANFDLDDS